jgi:hypothetical protein
MQATVVPVTAGEVIQLSDFPLYEYHYPGDYGFAEYLARGVSLAHPARGRFACSVLTAGSPGRRIFGRNFDWFDHPALVLFTDPPEGYAAVSLVDLSYLGYTERRTPLDDPNGLTQAPYLPFDGMNAQGLAVAMMAVPHAEGGDDPRRVTLEDLPAMRMLLDYARDVDEALALLEKVNVTFSDEPRQENLRRGGSWLRPEGEALGIVVYSVVESVWSRKDG